MLCATSADPNVEGTGLSPRLAAVVIALLALSFAGGALLFGLGGASSDSPAAPVAGGGCRERALAYGLGDDPSVARRMALAERVPVPERGFHTAADAPSPDQLLHAGSHGLVVVRYRLTDATVAPLRRLIARKARAGAAVVAAPAAAGAPPLTAMMFGRELRCRAAGERQVRAVERFIDSLRGAG
jgi:Protein of unknown function (DUF3105)